MISTKLIGEIHAFRMARTLVGRGLYYTAAYLVDGLMIDTGCAHTVNELMGSLNGKRVQMVVNTHSHEDHVGANAAIKEQFGAQSFTHPSAIPFLEDPRRRKLRPYQLVMWGYPVPSKPRPVGEVVETPQHRFKVIHTPGHSPDHVCLHEPDEGWLFTGDAYVGGKDRALRADYNIWKIVSSLKTLRDLKPRILFTGSGTVRDDAVPALQEKIDYLEETGERVLELHRHGLSYGRIRVRVFGPELPIAYMTLGNFSGRNLVRSFVEDAVSDVDMKRL
jgi:glyoxylase-like metal-dependent hydrolase (beta-lactamase superfamily II)